jgi:WD40 repeat protein
VALYFLYTKIAFSPNRKLLAGTCAEKGAIVWGGMHDGRELRRLSGHSALVSEVSFSPDGQRIATGSHDRTVKIWDTATGSLITTLNRQNAYVSAVIFSPDGRLLATGAADASVRIWHPDSGEELRTLPAAGTPSRIAFTPDGHCLLVATEDGILRGYLLEIDRSSYVVGFVHQPPYGARGTQAPCKPVTTMSWIMPSTLLRNTGS